MSAKPRILVVDDDPNLRKTLADILRIKGYETMIAATGAEAIAALTQASISLALIDLMLPDMNGMEVMERIKADSPLTETIILTGHASMDTAIEATRKGAFSYILKPYQMDDLLLNIRHGVERYQDKEEILRLASHPRLNPSPVIELSPEGEVTYLNPAAEKQFPDLVALGLEHPLLKGLGTQLAAAVSEQREIVSETALGDVTYEQHVYYVREINLVRVHVLDISERKRAEQEVRNYIDELTRANGELKRLNARLAQAQTQLMQSEKMASIGMLAAGVAHEINNPIGYIRSNLGALGNYIGNFLDLLDACERAERSTPELGGVFAELEALKGKIDFAYIRKDVAALLHESHEGVERVTRIVQDLKDFSRIETEEQWVAENIHRGIDSTLNVIWNELKYKCEVVREFGELPDIDCLPSQLNQVFMNLLVNAAQSIETRGRITIRTGREGERVWIEVGDTGQGIPPENISHLFDPFFTTKPVGKGTGLGLSVSYNIVEKHHGKIEVQSEIGKGTTFRVWLPIRQTKESA
jgi:signal transduction histidine kinase